MHRRTLALLLTTVLALVGCGSVEEGVRDLATTAEEVAGEIGSPGSGTAPDGAGGGTSGDSGTSGEDGGGAAGGDGQGAGGSAGDGGDQSGEDGSGGGGGQDAGVSTTPADDLGGVGANGRAYLRGDRTRLIVEVDVQEGASLDQAALDQLRSVIDRVADKNEIVFSGGNAFASDRREWTTADLRAAAEQHRQHFSDDSTATMYLLVVQGGFYRDGEQTNAIGVAYNASEMAVFPDRWSGLTAALGSSTAIARAVLVHEFGHLLGLVNLTYESKIDHEDPEHPGHSANRESVMYYAIETTLIGQVFTGPPPDRFDDADLADIEGLRTGRY